MKNYSFNKVWFDEIKNAIEYKNLYVYEEDGKEMVEVDILNSKEFERVSKELGWMA